MPRKVRQCPYCKSKKGFHIFITLGGHESKEMNFKGKILKQNRSGTDDIDKHGNCLECGKSIDAELLDLNNV